MEEERKQHLEVWAAQGLKKKKTVAIKQQVEKDNSWMKDEKNAFPCG